MTEDLPKVLELLPHRPPMVLIDRVLSYDPGANRVICATTVRPEWRESAFALEFMAQAAAALVALLDRDAGLDSAGRPGFLLGTRRLELNLSEFEAGQTYHISAQRQFDDGESASFDCRVYLPRDDGTETELATASLCAYRPADLRSFLSQSASGRAPSNRPAR